MDSLLTPKQVAQRLKIHYNTVLQYLNTGRIKGFRLGDNGDSKYPWRIKESELEAFINKSGDKDNDKARIN
jgi:excisionase family DNA binding protein